MGQRKTILFVDDEPGIRDVVSHYIELMDGFNIIFADNALLALQIFAVNQIDAIITDLAMPKHDGKEFIEAIHQSGREVPIAVISNLGDVLADDPTIKKAVMILPKPISLDEFVLGRHKLVGKKTEL